MAKVVNLSLEESKHLVVEAGTGVGKSLAYLFPAALWAARNKKKVVIATYTKALQEQLVGKDLPTVKSTIELSGLAFNYHLLMGSGNYLCLRRLKRATRQPGLFVDDSQTALDRMLEWVRTASSGRRGDLPFRTPEDIWAEVCRDSDICLGKRCDLKEVCLYRKDVARARQADLVVINQALFFAGVPLPTFDAIIFDEAHNLEDVALHFLGFSLTSRNIKRLLDDICNPGSGRGLAKRIQGQPPNWMPRIQEAITDVQFASKMFFADLRAKLVLPEAGEGPAAKRVQTPRIVEDNLSPELHKLSALLADAIAVSRSAEDETEIKALRNRCLQTMEQLASFLGCRSTEHAYWVEVSRSKKTPHTSLRMVPLEVAESLRKDLFAKHSPVILTSATLAVDGDFAMIRARLGLDDSREALLDSPFEYERQAALFSVPDIPDPKDTAAFEQAVLEYCPKVAGAITGGLFVLYTSWQLLEKSVKVLTAEATQRPIFKQGSKLPQQLLADFKQAGNGILLATDTFWQGIDVPGAALSCVVITRLPFLSPDTPLEEARQEWMAAKGMNVFTEYTLPKAVIKFRQGFGRLIRSNTDFGAVVILDPRIKAASRELWKLRSPWLRS